MKYLRDNCQLWFHQSFGELRRISRKDGALYVSWKKASVADNVSCDIYGWPIVDKRA